MKIFELKYKEVVFAEDEVSAKEKFIGLLAGEDYSFEEEQIECIELEEKR